MDAGASNVSALILCRLTPVWFQEERALLLLDVRVINLTSNDTTGNVVKCN